jgi:hypothetical protein
MKKSILMLLAAVMLFAVSSCKEDDNQGPDKKQIIIDNQWKLTSVETENESTEFDAAMSIVFAAASIEFDFQDDGVYEMTMASILGGNETDTGTWSISDDYKTITLNGGAGNIKECTNSVLKITSPAGTIDFGQGEYADETGNLTLVFSVVAE